MGDAHVCSLRSICGIPKIMTNLIFCIYHLPMELTFFLKDLEDFEEAVYTEMEKRWCQGNMMKKDVHKAVKLAMSGLCALCSSP